MSNYLVSIIVPIYKMEKYLPKCIDSIINQTYKNLEIILVDDGSPDNCPQICEDYGKKDNRIKVLHKKNGGLSDARNAGLNITTGDYITFIDSDDYYELDAIEKLVYTITKTNSKIALMKCCMKNENNEIIIDKSNGTNEIFTYNSQEYMKFICYSGETSVCTILFHNSLFKHNNFKKGRLNEDALFLYNSLFEDFKIGVIDFSGYNYIQHNNSITHDINKKSVYDTVQNAYEVYLRACNEKPNYKEYLGRLLLYQARTVFIIMPFNFVKTNNEIYVNTLNYMRQCLKYIDQVNLSKFDKSFLKLVNISPKITIYIIQNLFKIKNMLRGNI